MMTKHDRNVVKAYEIRSYMSFDLDDVHATTLATRPFQARLNIR